MHTERTGRIAKREIPRKYPGERRHTYRSGHRASEEKVKENTELEIGRFVSTLLFR